MSAMSDHCDYLYELLDQAKNRLDDIQLKIGDVSMAQSDFDIHQFVAKLARDFKLFVCDEKRACGTGVIQATCVIPGAFTEALTNLRGQAWYNGYIAGKEAMKRAMVHDRKFMTKLARLRLKILGR